MELLAGDSGFESIRVLNSLNDSGMDNLVAWRRLKGRENPPNCEW